MSLMAALSRSAQGLQRRFPVATGLIDGTRTAVFVVDSLLSAFLFFAWFLTVGFALKLLELVSGDAQRSEGRIAFLSQEGFVVAPTRIRSYFFAECVAAKGYPTRTIAFWDEIYGFKHLPDRPIFGVEKVLVSIRSVHLLLAENPSVIIEQRPTYDLLATSVVRWIRRTPVIFDIDDWIGDYVWFFPVKVSKALPYFSSMASACIVSSTQLENELAKTFSRVIKIPTYVDTSAFRPREAPPECAEVVFGWNGTLFQEFMYESLLLMVNAFVSACDRLGNSVSIVLEVAGTGDHYCVIEDLCKTEYSGYPIRMKGWLDPRTMGEYLDGIDVGLYSLVVTEKRRGTPEETFILSKSPTKVFEYMAKGIPTISTRIGEVANVLESGVTGYCTDDLAELADAFVHLAKDADLRLRMGQSARSICLERFSMSTAAQELIDAVLEVGGAKVVESKSEVANGVTT